MVNAKDYPYQWLRIADNEHQYFFAETADLMDAINTFHGFRLPLPDDTNIDSIWDAATAGEVSAVRAGTICYFLQAFLIPANPFDAVELAPEFPAVLVDLGANRAAFNAAQYKLDETHQHDPAAEKRYLIAVCKKILKDIEEGHEPY